jgi:hypothetical protein
MLPPTSATTVTVLEVLLCPANDKAKLSYYHSCLLLASSVLNYAGSPCLLLMLASYYASVAC